MKKQLMTKLDYNNGVGVLSEGDFRIGASSIADFFSNTRQWFGDNLLGEKSFIGNQATLRGTCTHFCAERFALTKTFTPEDKQEVLNYILKSTNQDYEDYIPDSDAEDATTQYAKMGSVLVNDYVIHNMPVCVEAFVASEILPGIFVGGSIDALYNGRPLSDNKIESLRNTSGMVIVDYKTSSSTRLPDSIAFKHKLQLLTYAYVLRKEYNITSDRIRIVYVTTEVVGEISPKTGKQFKSYPSEVKVLTENVTEQDFEYIEGIIHLIAESVDRWKKVPTDRYLLAKDYRLKFSEAPSVTNTNLFAKLSEDD